MTTLGNGQPKNLTRQIFDRWKVADTVERGEWEMMVARYCWENERGARLTTHDDVAKKMEEDGWVPPCPDIF